MKKFRLFLILLSVAILALLSVAYVYRFHLTWIYASRNMDVSRMRALPDSTMPEIPIPDDWVTCRFQNLEYRLPPELAATEVVQGMGPTPLYRYESRSVWMDMYESDFTFLDMAAKFNPKSAPRTMSQLRYAWYKTDANEFSWRMTPAEARWFACRMTFGRLGRFDGDDHIETFFSSEIEGTAIFDTAGTHLRLYWQSRTLPFEGYVNFIDKRETRNLDWARAAARSLKIVED